MKAILFFTCQLLALFSLAQVQIEHGLVGSSAVREFTIFNPNAQPAGRIPYDIVRGSAFANEGWQLASLYKDMVRVATLPVRLNLATHEIHYLKNAEELVVQPVTGINTVMFHVGEDATTTSAVYRKLSVGPGPGNQQMNGFFQQLNEGHCRLLKYTDRRLIEGDSLHGTYKRYFFRDEKHYVIQLGETNTPVKKLGNEAVLALLPQSGELLPWMKEQKLNLRKEEDLLRFLARYNARQSDSAR